MCRCEVHNGARLLVSDSMARVEQSILSRSVNVPRPIVIWANNPSRAHGRFGCPCGSWEARRPSGRSVFGPISSPVLPTRPCPAVQICPVIMEGQIAKGPSFAFTSVRIGPWQLSRRSSDSLVIILIMVSSLWVGGSSVLYVRGTLTKVRWVAFAWRLVFVRAS